MAIYHLGASRAHGGDTANHCGFTRGSTGSRNVRQHLSTLPVLLKPFLLNLINLRSHRTIQPPTHTPKHTHQPPNRQNYPAAQPSQPSTCPPPRKGPKWGAALTFSILMVFSSKKPQKTKKTEPPPKTQNPKTPKTPKHITAFACEGSRVLKNRQTEGLDIWGFVFFVSFGFFLWVFVFFRGSTASKKNQNKNKKPKTKKQKIYHSLCLRGF